jgi:flagellar hook-length control protein FliK
MIAPDSSVQQSLFALFSGMLGTDPANAGDAAEFASLFSDLLDASEGDEAWLADLQNWLQSEQPDTALWPSPGQAEASESVAPLAAMLGALAANRFRPGAQSVANNAATPPPAASAGQAATAPLAGLIAAMREHGMRPLGTQTSSPDSLGVALHQQIHGRQRNEFDGSPLLQGPLSLSDAGQTSPAGVERSAQNVGFSAAEFGPMVDKLAPSAREQLIAMAQAMNPPSPNSQERRADSSSAASVTATTLSSGQAALSTSARADWSSAVPLPTQSQNFAQALGEQVRLLLGQGQQRALIRLDPPHLGSLEIQMQSEGEHTRVHFVAASPAAREALEQALPRLRELFAEQGEKLDADVSERQNDLAGQGGGQNDKGDQDEAPLNPLYARSDAEGGDAASLEVGPVSGLGLLDAYA